MIGIKTRYTGEIIHKSLKPSFREAVEEAVKSEISLKYADLSGADLRGVDLFGVDLGGSDLRGADLTGANLGSSNLHRANLLGANLTGAYLQGANLCGASLIDTDLFDVKLTAKNFAPNCFYTFRKRGGRKCYAIIEPHNGYFVRIIAGCFNDSIKAFEAESLNQYGDDEAENYQPQLRELKPKIKKAIQSLKANIHV